MKRVRSPSHHSNPDFEGRITCGEKWFNIYFYFESLQSKSKILSACKPVYLACNTEDIWWVPQLNGPNSLKYKRQGPRKSRNSFWLDPDLDSTPPPPYVPAQAHSYNGAAAIKAKVHGSSPVDNLLQFESQREQLQTIQTNDGGTEMPDEQNAFFLYRPSNDRLAEQCRQVSSVGLCNSLDFDVDFILASNDYVNKVIQVKQ